MATPAVLSLTSATAFRDKGKLYVTLDLGHSTVKFGPVRERSENEKILSRSLLAAQLDVAVDKIVDVSYIESYPDLLNYDGDALSVQVFDGYFSIELEDYFHSSEAKVLTIEHAIIERGALALSYPVDAEGKPAPHEKAVQMQLIADHLIKNTPELREQVDVSYYRAAPGEDLKGIAVKARTLDTGDVILIADTLAPAGQVATVAAEIVSADDSGVVLKVAVRRSQGITQNLQYAFDKTAMLVHRAGDPSLTEGRRLMLGLN